jgi:uncharacterized protein (DUF2062 family)
VRNIFPQLKEKLIAVVRKLLSLRASPHEIAIGFGIGVFIGIFPTFGLGGLLILALLPFWKFNLTAALLGTTLGNPIFAPIWISMTCLVTGISPSEIKPPQETIEQVIVHYSQIGFRYLLGNFGISLVMAIISYFSIIRAVHWNKKRHNKSNFNK